ncbi:GU4 nucleic-binding protein [Purpureocillium lavendulum]|uniref:GU4 nucleic-binding protein n=1 Tax=Purpureocillium lavendulum TaxID=1247861 RepID=A0AB34G1W6_9HYPO|nr:GU4 nucleic-binding protein [Purpureocillium lavendulum]
MLHEFAADGDMITVSDMGPMVVHTRGSFVKTNAKRPRSPRPSSPPPAKGAGWELGFGVGGWIYQDVVPDDNASRWNWKKSQLLNVQLLNAVAFQSFTGFPPPEVPISFRDYVASGIPFDHVLPRASILGSDIISKLESVSEADSGKGVVRSAMLQGVKPVQCPLCEKMLADTM